MTEAEWLAWLAACNSMKEQEWLALSEPYPMLTFLRDKGSARKLRLFACACCRRIWHVIEKAVSRHAVDVAERFAEGLVSGQELSATERITHELYLDLGWGSKRYAAGAANRTVWDDGRDAALRTSEQASQAVSISHGGPWADAAARNEELGAQAVLLREVFGNPFRSVAFEPAWRTSTATSLAEAIYADRAFDRLIILADALEDAGCTNQDILSHCRQPGDHVRGCWVVDLVLGKE